MSKRNGDYEKSDFIFAIETVCITLESKENFWKKREMGRKPKSNIETRKAAEQKQEADRQSKAVC